MRALAEMKTPENDKLADQAEQRRRRSAKMGKWYIDLVAYFGCCLASSNCSISEAISRQSCARSRYISRISTCRDKRAASSHSFAFRRHACARSVMVE